LARSTADAISRGISRDIALSRSGRFRQIVAIRPFDEYSILLYFNASSPHSIFKVRAKVRTKEHIRAQPEYDNQWRVSKLLTAAWVATNRCACPIDLNLQSP
jgi:hypothetical protein